MTAEAGGPDRSLVPVAAAFLAAVIGMLFYYLGSDRLDFAAHFVAGLGGTMVLLSILSLVAIRHGSPPRGWPILALTLLACGLGVAGEALIFVEGGFDVVDVSNQSLGAVTAALIFVAWPVRGGRVILLWILLAVAMLVGGARLVALF
jgi:hypothetical protein